MWLFVCFIKKFKTLKIQKLTLKILYICSVAQTGTDILAAKHFLENGQLVAIPTETVYGLAANALKATDVAKIFEAKNRPEFDPLIVHTHSLDAVYEFVTDIHPDLLKLAKAFWPGPLTLLLPKKDLIPDLTTSGLDRVGVRIPDHPLTLQLLQQLNFPLAAPSANPFGYISPTTAEHVERQLGDKIPYILDGSACEVGLESTIVGEENNELIIYRLGGLSIDAIESIVGSVSIQLNQSSNPKAPGQLKSHYAPKKPVFVGNVVELQKEHAHQNAGFIIFGAQAAELKGQVVLNLSPQQDYKEAAANLFAFLRELDESDVDLILCDILPGMSLGLAINDRLRRAAG
jgi:L-threonylcarbamoyladenylate synthase